jgi:hypothetical protein
MNETNEPNRPTHALWQVIGEKPKSRWIQIGVAFTNRDGSLQLKFDALPYIGRTMLRPIDGGSAGDGQA